MNLISTNFFQPKVRCNLVFIALFAVLFFVSASPQAEALTAITNCTELQNMSVNLAENYSLSNNIDCSATSGWNAGKGFIPIGNNNAGAFVGFFTGSLEGNGFTIQNIHIVRPTENFIGIIGQTNGAEFLNVGVTGSIEGRSNVGTLVGAMNGADTVDNASSTVTIIGHTQNIGGLAGDAGNVVAVDSFYAGSITINEPSNSIGNTGGLFGQCTGDIDGSTASTTMTLTGSTVYGIGGLVGINSGTMTGINAAGTISVTSAGSSVDGVGGLFGEFGGTATFATSSVDITVTTDDAADIGGLVGVDNGSTIIGGVASGDITVNASAVGQIGGLVGSDFFGTIGDVSAIPTYSSGAILITGTTIDHVAGLVGGVLFGTVYASNISRSITINGGTVGFVGGEIGESFASVYSGNSSAVITITGTDVDDVGGLMGNNLGSVLQSHSSGDVSVDSDTATFVGGFIGGGGGGVEESYSTSDVAVTTSAGPDSGIGGFIGSGSGSFVLTSYSSGSVTVTSPNVNGVGGFQGLDDSAGQITNSFSASGINIHSATASGVGGFFGSGQMTLDNVYAAGTVAVSTTNTISFVGGLVGNLTTGGVSDAFSAGLVSAQASSTITEVGGFIGSYDGGTTFSHNYFDKTTSAQLLCTGQDVADPAWCTFQTDPDVFKSNSNAPIFTGWDFTTVWVIDSCDYPVLQALPSPYSTVCAPPTVTTQAASGIGATSATLNGTITATGGANATVRGFAYGLTTAYGATTTESGSFGTGAFSTSTIVFACGTTYHFKAYATNPTGTGYGSDLSFSTSACPAGGPPAVTATAASQIRSNSAALNGEVTSIGGSSLTDKGFIHRLATGSYDATTSVPTSLTVGAFSNTLSGLSCSTAYRYRAYATNATDLVYSSEEISFTTASCGSQGGGGSIPTIPSCPLGYLCTPVIPTPPPPPPPPPPVIPFTPIIPFISTSTSTSTIPFIPPPGITIPLPTPQGTPTIPVVPTLPRTPVTPSIPNIPAIPVNPGEEIPDVPLPRTNPRVPPILDDAITATRETLKTFPGRFFTDTAITISLIVGALMSASALFGDTLLKGAAMSLTDVAAIPSRVWNMIALAVGWKKRRSPWGVVYDSETERPLDPAYVEVKDQNGKTVAEAFTDIDGRYGFILPPGTYTMTAAKTNYVFPSKSLAGEKSDKLYQDLYFGETFTVQAEDDVLQKNLPLDPVAFDWNEFAKVEQHLIKYYAKRDRFWNRLSGALFIIGLAYSIFVTVAVPSTFNIIIVTLYAVLLIVRMFGWKPHSHGSITDSRGNPLSFAIVHVKTAESGTEIGRAIADEYGRYFCLVADGRYRFTIDRKNPDGSYSEVLETPVITAKGGIIKKNFVI